MDNSIRKDYEILGLEPGATVEEIRQKYKNLHRVWDPETFHSDPQLSQKAQSKIIEIDRAFEELLLYLLDAQPVAERNPESELSSVEERTQDDLIDRSEHTIPLSNQLTKQNPLVENTQTHRKITTDKKKLIWRIILAGGLVFFILTAPKQFIFFQEIGGGLSYGNQLKLGVPHEEAKKISTRDGYIYAFGMTNGVSIPLLGIFLATAGIIIKFKNTRTRRNFWILFFSSSLWGSIFQVISQNTIKVYSEPFFGSTWLIITLLFCIMILLSKIIRLIIVKKTNRNSQSKQTRPSFEQLSEPNVLIENKQTSQDSSQTQQQQQKQAEEWYYYNYGWKGPCTLTILRELYSKRQIDENTFIKSNNVAEEIALKDSALFLYINDIPSKAEAEEARSKEKARLIS